MDKILSINLETQTAPVIQEVRGRDYIEYGTEEWRNLYPQFLLVEVNLQRFDVVAFIIDNHMISSIKILDNVW